MEKKPKHTFDKTIMIVIAIIIVLVYAFFRYFKIDKKRRLEEIKKELESQKRLLSYLNNGQEKEIANIEWWYKYMPYFLRGILVLLLFFYDWFMVWLFKSEINSTGKNNILDLLKEITIYNATLLTLILIFAFLFGGKIWKLEDLITYLNNRVNSMLFKRYFSKLEKRADSKNHYKKDIEKIDIRINEIDKTLELY